MKLFARFLVRQKKKKKSIAVIGDGSMTGGMAFEALNRSMTTPTTTYHASQRSVGTSNKISKPAGGATGDVTSVFACDGA